MTNARLQAFLDPGQILADQIDIRDQRGRRRDLGQLHALRDQLAVSQGPVHLVATEAQDHARNRRDQAGPVLGQAAALPFELRIRQRRLERPQRLGADQAVVVELLFGFVIAARGFEPLEPRVRGGGEPDFLAGDLGDQLAGFDAVALGQPAAFRVSCDQQRPGGVRAQRDRFRRAQRTGGHDAVFHVAGLDLAHAHRHAEFDFLSVGRRSACRRGEDDARSG